MRRALLVGLAIAVVASAIMVLRRVGSDSATTAPPISELGAVGVRTSGCGLADELGVGVLSGPGRIVTSAHVVAGASEITVVVDGREQPAVVDVFDPEKDLAVLQADLVGAPASTATVRSGDAAWVASWIPDEGVRLLPTVVNRRIRVTIEDIYIQGEYQRDAIELATGLPRGSSGAGVFDSAGSLVGIVYASSRQREASFALDGTEIDALLALADGEPHPNGRCP